MKTRTVAPGGRRREHALPMARRPPVFPPIVPYTPRTPRTYGHTSRASVRIAQRNLMATHVFFGDQE